MILQSLVYRLKAKPLEIIRSFLLYCLFFSLILLVGKHFWLDFSFVSGVRVDYLSPTLFFSDIIIFLLFGVEVISVLSERRYKFFLVTGGIILVFLLYAPFVHSLPAHFYGAFMLLKFTFVGYLVARYFSNLYLSTFLTVLSFAVLIESLLIFAQFIIQSSIEGPFYYLGERAISSETIGAATFQFSGQEILRSYGTFPHPNVAAFFLYFALVFLVLAWRKYNRGIYMFSILLGSTALLFTFSRVIIILYGVFLLGYFFSRKIKYLVVILLAGVSLYVTFFSSRFGLESFARDFSYRKELFDISIRLIQESYLFGSGLLNYFYLQIAYHTQITPTFLQPVHNIYLLVFIQIGVVGGVVVLFLLGKTILRAFRLMRSGDFFDVSVFILLVSALIVGLFDHFLLTLQQGILIMAIIIGLVWREK